MKLEVIIGMIVVIALIFALGVYTLDNIQGTQEVNTTAYNVTGEGVSGLSGFSSLMTPIVFIFIAIAMFWGIKMLVQGSKTETV